MSFEPETPLYCDYCAEKIHSEDQAAGIYATTDGGSRILHIACKEPDLRDRMLDWFQVEVARYRAFTRAVLLPGPAAPRSMSDQAWRRYLDARRCLQGLEIPLPAGCP